MKLILAILILIYVLNPFDIVPDFLIGWGWLDDGVLLYLLWRYILTPMMREKLTQRLFGQNRQYYQQKEAPHVHENKSPRDPYTILGIKRSASKEEIKTAFKRLANQYHPDKVQHLGEEFRELAEKRFKEIQEAYQQLK